MFFVTCFILLELAISLNGCVLQQNCQTDAIEEVLDGKGESHSVKEAEDTFLEMKLVPTGSYQLYQCESNKLATAGEYYVPIYTVQYHHSLKPCITIFF